MLFGRAIGKALSPIKAAAGGAGHHASMSSVPSPAPVWPLWLALSSLTLLLAALTDWHPGGPALAWLAQGGAWLKGVAIIESWMALRQAPRWLRAVVHGWLWLVCAGLALSFV